jgi:hypothetical protein
MNMRILSWALQLVLLGTVAAGCGLGEAQDAGGENLGDESAAQAGTRKIEWNLDEKDNDGGENYYHDMIRALRERASDQCLLNKTYALTSDKKQFIEIQVTQGGNHIISLFVQSSSLYVVGWSTRVSGDWQYIQIDDQPVPSGQTVALTTPFGGDYGALERAAEQERTAGSLGQAGIAAAVQSLASANPGAAISWRPRARALLVLIQAVSESARFRPITRTIRHGLTSGIATQASEQWLDLENHWSALGRNLQNAVESDTDPVAYTSNFVSITTLADYSRFLALILYINSNRPPRRLVRAVPVEDGRVYSLAPKVNTRSCMDLTKNNSTSGTLIQEWGCHEGDSQVFEVRPNSSKLDQCVSAAACAKLKNIVHVGSGMCIDVQFNVPRPNAPVQIYACNNTRAQRFEIVKASSSGEVTIRWPIKSTFGRSGRDHDADYCMEVANAGTANGTKVQVNYCNGSDAQKWVALPAS